MGIRCFSILCWKEKFTAAFLQRGRWHWFGHDWKLKTLIWFCSHIKKRAQRHTLFPPSARVTHGLTARTHVRTHARMHACTHRTHAHTHTHTHTHTQHYDLKHVQTTIRLIRLCVNRDFAPCSCLARILHHILAGYFGIVCTTVSEFNLGSLGVIQ